MLKVNVERSTRNGAVEWDLSVFQSSMEFDLRYLSTRPRKDYVY